MKYVLIIMLAAAVMSCATNKSATFSYSGVFKVAYPLSLLSGATVFSADGLSLKTAEGNTISGVIASREIDNLPVDLDMRAYPEFLFGLKKYSGSSGDVQEKFENTKMAFDGKYDLSNIDINSKNGVTRYSACKKTSCLGFVVKDSFSDHILMVYSEGFNKKVFLEFLDGAVYAK